MDKPAAKTAQPIDKAEFDALMARHRAAPAHRGYACATHVEQRGGCISRQTYSAAVHGIPTIEVLHAVGDSEAVHGYRKFA